MIDRKAVVNIAERTAPSTDTTVLIQWLNHEYWEVRRIARLELAFRDEVEEARGGEGMTVEVDTLVKVSNPQSALNGRIGRVVSVNEVSGTVVIRMVGLPYDGQLFSFGPNELRRL